MTEHRLSLVQASGSQGERGALAAQSGRLRTLYYIAASVLGALIPLVLLAGFWFSAELREEQTNLEAALMARTVGLVGRVDTEIQRQISVLHAVASLPSLDDSSLPDGADLPAFREAAARMMQAMPQWEGLSLFELETGRRIVDSGKPLGGDLGVSEAPELVRRVAQTGQPATRSAKFEAGRPITEHCVSLYVPVMRAGRVRFVLAAGMKTEIVQAVLTDAGRDDPLLSTIVDENGVVLARSREPERHLGERAQGLTVDATGPVLGLVTESTPDGHEGYTAVQRSPLTGWRAVVVADRAEVQRLAGRSTWTAIGTGALSLTLASILSVFLVYNLVERRVGTERLVASRALGDLDARLVSTTQDAQSKQEQAASERAVLLKEIYHRVKNNLQIIQSLLRLGARRLAPEQREPFESAIRRIGAMARVHALLYTSPDLTSVDFREYLDELMRETASAHQAGDRSVRAILKAETMRLPLDIALPLAFIAAELVTNAFRHAFPEGRGGSVTVTIERDGDLARLIVEDDGVGMPAQQDAKSLGLTIVTNLIRQIGGVLHRPGPGRSAFTIEFPLVQEVAGAWPGGLEPPGVGQSVAA